jgi:hypothetical protein
MFAVGDETPVYYSTNSGSTWHKAKGAPTSTYSAVVSAQTGARVFAAVAFGPGNSCEGPTQTIAGVWVSENYGETFTQHPTAPRIGITALDCDKECQLAVITARPLSTSNNPDSLFYPTCEIDMIDSPGGIYLFDGVDWFLSSAPTGVQWSAVVMSGDGHTICASILGGHIYCSGNGGVDWIITTAPETTWQSLSIDQSGRYVNAIAIALSTRRGSAYHSKDHGKTWSLIASKHGWSSIANNLDGSRIVATVYQGKIYSLSVPGAAQTFVTSSVILGLLLLLLMISLFITYHHCQLTKRSKRILLKEYEDAAGMIAVHRWLLNWCQAQPRTCRASLALELSATILQVAVCTQISPRYLRIFEPQCWPDYVLSPLTQHHDGKIQRHWMEPSSCTAFNGMYEVSHDNGSVSYLRVSVHIRAISAYPEPIQAYIRWYNSHVQYTCTGQILHVDILECHSNRRDGDWKAWPAHVSRQWSRMMLCFLLDPKLFRNYHVLANNCKQFQQRVMRHMGLLQRGQKALTEQTLLLSQ